MNFSKIGSELFLESPVLSLENNYKLYKNGYELKFTCLDSLMSLFSIETSKNFI